MCRMEFRCWLAGTLWPRPGAHLARCRPQAKERAYATGTAARGCPPCRLLEFGNYLCPVGQSKASCTTQSRERQGCRNVPVFTCSLCTCRLSIINVGCNPPARPACRPGTPAPPPGTPRAAHTQHRSALRTHTHTHILILQPVGCAFSQLHIIQQTNATTPAAAPLRFRHTHTVPSLD